MRKTIHSGINNSFFRLFLFFAVCFFAVDAIGQTLTVADFEKALSNSGVNLIPFANLRREAASIAGEVDRCKSAVSGWSYSNWKPKKDALLKKKAEKERQVASKEKDIAALKSKFKTVDVSREERELATYKRELSDISEDIDDLNDQLEDGAEVWERLWNARGGLREKFDDVKDELDRAKSNPKSYIGSSASDADVAKVRSAVDKIKSKIESEEDGHEKAETDAQNAEENFRELIEKSSL